MKAFVIGMKPQCGSFVFFKRLLTCSGLLCFWRLIPTKGSILFFFNQINVFYIKNHLRLSFCFGVQQSTAGSFSKYGDKYDPREFSHGKYLN